MRFKLFVISIIAFFVLIGCAANQLIVLPDTTPEIAREVNWAVVELNNLAVVRRWYRCDYGEDPERIEDLFPHLERYSGLLRRNNTSDGGNVCSSPVYDWWDFNLGFTGEVVDRIFCVSTELMAEGADNKITYTLSTASYSGYGLNYLYPGLYPLLIERMIDGAILFTEGELWNPAEVEQRFKIIRQVNWAGATIGAFYNAVKMYRQDYGEDPVSRRELTEQEYVEIPAPVDLWWEFHWQGINPITHIHAVSTELMAGGAGDTLSYNIETGEFEGPLTKYLSPWVQTFVIVGPLYIQYVPGARASDSIPTAK